MDSVCYHYCSLDKFQKIIQSREIWLSHIFSLNDSAEFQWLHTVALRVLRKWRERNATTRESHGVFNSLEGKLSSLGEDADLYCCCLSEDGDSLGQWRAYADDGRGVAAGVGIDFLNGLESQHFGLRLQHVEYSLRRQEEIVERIIESLTSPDGSQASGLPDDRAAIFGKVQVRYNAAACKNPTFHAEREVRLIYAPSLRESNPPKSGPPKLSERRSRSEGDREIPYYALELPSDLGVIEEIVFGPQCPWKDNHQAACDLLSEYGYDIGRIHFWNSESTYRNPASAHVQTEPGAGLTRVP